METSGRATSAEGSGTLHQWWTTKELARRAGCSVQHVRDLERQGVLPVAGRGANGYRQFGVVHLRLLLAYRSLARAIGPAEAKRLLLLVVTAARGTVVADNAAAADPAIVERSASPPVSWRDVLSALDEAHARLHGERLALGRARAVAAAISAERIDAPVAGDAMSISEVAAALGVRASALRHWEAEGLLSPGRLGSPGLGLLGRSKRVRSYAPVDVRDARIVDQLRRAGYRIPELRVLMAQVREFGDGADVERALRARAADLDARSAALLAAGGELSGLLSAG